MWIGIELGTTGAYCIAMAALLHYFVMVAFTWMLVEAILGFLLAIRGSAVSKNRFILKASVPAWGKFGHIAMRRRGEKVGVRKKGQEEGGEEE